MVRLSVSQSVLIHVVCVHGHGIIVVYRSLIPQAVMYKSLTLTDHNRLYYNDVTHQQLTMIEVRAGSNRICVSYVYIRMLTRCSII